MSAYRWTILATAFLLQSMYTMLQQGIPILTPFFHSAFNLSLAGAGVLVSCFNAGLVISSLPSGLLVDRVGERWSVTFGSIMACTLVLATLLVQDKMFAVGGLLFLGGLLSGTVSISSGKAVFSWFDERERGLAMGIRQIAIPVGAAIASISLPLLGGIGGWQLPLAFIGAAQFVAAMIFLTALRQPPGERPHTQPAMLKALGSVLSDRPMAMTALVSMVLVLTQYILLAYLILYLTSEGFSRLVASSGLLVVQLGAVTGRIVWGRVSDRAFNGARKPVVARIILLATVTVASLAATSGHWPLWAVYLQLLAIGGTSISWNGLVVTLMAELGGSQRAGAAIGLNSASVYFGALISAPLFGAIVDATHSYRFAFLGLAATTLCALIPLVCIKEPHAAHQPALLTP